MDILEETKKLVEEICGYCEGYVENDVRILLTLTGYVGAAERMYGAKCFAVNDRQKVEIMEDKKIFYVFETYHLPETTKIPVFDGVFKLDRAKEWLDPLNTSRVEVPNRATEEWNRESGIWKITTSTGIKQITTGRQGTETNEAFFKLYEMKNKDIRGSEIRSHVADTVGKKPVQINLGSSVTKLRQWIKDGLGQEFESLVTLHLYDRSTKTYKLELNF